MAAVPSEIVLHQAEAHLKKQRLGCSFNQGKICDGQKCRAQAEAIVPRVNLPKYYICQRYARTCVLVCTIPFVTGPAVLLYHMFIAKASNMHRHKFPEYYMQSESILSRTKSL